MYKILLSVLMLGSLTGCTIAYGGAIARSDSVIIVKETSDSLSIVVNSANDDKFIQILKTIKEDYLKND